MTQANSPKSFLAFKPTQDAEIFLLVMIISTCEVLRGEIWALRGRDGRRSQRRKGAEEILLEEIL